MNVQFLFSRRKPHFTMTTRFTASAAAAATAVVVAVATVAKYTHLAMSGRVFPFAPVTLHEDPDGTYNKGKYSTPTLKIDWYLSHDDNLRKRAQEAKKYQERRSDWHFKDKNHITPLRLSVWPSAVSYFLDYLGENSGQDRRCVHIMGQHIGEGELYRQYVTSVIVDKLSE